MSQSLPVIDQARARALWLQAQRLQPGHAFGSGSEAAARMVAHLGYVQIDTIHVIERSHHHILYTRLPDYRPADLHAAQAQDKSVFEYWTHALAYVPTADYRFFLPAMQAFCAQPPAGYAAVDPADYAQLLRRIREQGPLSIRDIDDDELVAKDHPWGSRKPSRRLMRMGFYSGDLVVSQRQGMVKSYELAARHFGWARKPRPASEAQVADYLLQRALRSQALVNLDSICYGQASAKPAVVAAIARAQRAGKLRAVRVEGQVKGDYWMEPALLDRPADAPDPGYAHLLSPFDPLVIQRKRLLQFFGYTHRFEAYVPAAKRQYGYFALPVLIGERIVAALDLKMDRAAGRLEVRQWSWIAPERSGERLAIEQALARFERFHRLDLP